MRYSTKWIVFLVTIFCTACLRNESRRINPKEERAHNDVEAAAIEAFLNEVLFQEGGVFTLLGDKPMTSICVPVGQEHCVPKSCEENVQWRDVRTEEYWHIWKRYYKQMKPRRFVFIEHVFPHDPSNKEICLVNVRKVSSVSNLSEEQLLEQLSSPKSVFWERMRKDHEFAALVYGYGKQAAAYFLNGKDKCFSDNFNTEAASDNFPIPIFACDLNDAQAIRYREERERIKRLTEGKTALEVFFMSIND